MPRINYDEIAHRYDEPARNHGVDGHLTTYLASRPDPGRRRTVVLDVACGTGKQLAVNRQQLPDLYYVGLDRSRAMLNVARVRGPEIPWIQADAVALPLRTGTIAYVTCQFAHAHIEDKRGLIAEAHRVLAPGGQFVLTNIDPWSMRNWMMYRYFPAAETRDRVDFVEAETLLGDMREAGFCHARVERMVRDEEASVREFLAFATDRVRASQLTAISDADYAQGLARLAERAGRPDLPPTERSVFCLATFIGEKASPADGLENGASRV
jgi:SAM-dependent methyltransferase